MTQSSVALRMKDRGVAFWLAVVASVTLIALYVADVACTLGFHGLADGWQELMDVSIAAVTVQTVLSWIFWLSAIALVVALFADRMKPGAAEVEVEDAAFVRFLFHNSRAGLLWLPIRLFLALAWLNSGLNKIVDENWQNGTVLAGFWGRNLEVPEQGSPAITFDWYRSFIQLLVDGGHEGWFTWIVMLGEISIGVGLLFGILTGMAAFFGALMNMTYLLAGSVSTNPVLFTLAIGIVLAWRVAGYYGVDRYLLPRLGTLWKPGTGAGIDRPVPDPPAS